MLGKTGAALLVVGWLVVVGAEVAPAGEASGGAGLSSEQLKVEAARNEALREYIDLYGLPEYADWRPIAGDFPWSTREVWLYYLARNRAVAFGTAFIVGRPWVSLIRSQGPIPPERAAEIRRLLRGPEALAEEAEAAAARAEEAAARATVAGEAAAEAAGRAEEAVAGVEKAFWSSTRK